MKKIAFTGHRPPKIGLTYDGTGSNHAYQMYIQNCLNDEVEKVGNITVITGGALGIDQIALEAAIEVNGYARSFDIRDRDIDSYLIKQIVAEPFDGFSCKWPKQSVEKYERLKKYSCAEVIHVCESGYAAWKMQKRNEWMVDNCDELWAVWDGTQGGTKNCVEYAKSKNKKIRNLHEEYNAK